MTKRRGCRDALSELPKHRHHIQGYTVAQKLFHAIILQEQKSLLEGMCGLVHDYLFMGKASLKLACILMSILDSCCHRIVAIVVSLQGL